MTLQGLDELKFQHRLHSLLRQSRNSGKREGDVLCPERTFPESCLGIPSKCSGQVILQLIINPRSFVGNSEHQQEHQLKKPLQTFIEFNQLCKAREITLLGNVQGNFINSS